jgi:hypothetical protein
MVCEAENNFPWKLFIVKGDGTFPLIPRGEYGYFVNCEYKPVMDERIVSLEGRLSLRLPDGRLRSFQVRRFKRKGLSASTYIGNLEPAA